MKFFFSKKSKPKETEEPVKIEADAGESEEIAAVIGLALRLYSYRYMEQEETLAAIQKAIKPYSPWNSKIYNMKQLPYHRSPARRIK